jgi:hypothetical protein
MKKLIFDVESDGMYGQGFAIGYIILDDKNNIIKYDSIKSREEIKNEWVKENVLPNLKTIKTVDTNKELRTIFYNVLQENKDCEIWSDVNFPVETNFLSDIAKDDIDDMAFNMPYPLKDISTIVIVNVSRKDVFNNKLFSRYEQLIHSKNVYEIKEHNPLHDCVASAYVLTQNKNIVDSYINLKLYK